MQTDYDYLDEVNPAGPDWDKARVMKVVDQTTNEIIFASAKYFNNQQQETMKALDDFMQTKFPDWRNVNAYWD